MNRKLIALLLLTPLMTALEGCQREESTQQAGSAAPAMVAASQAAAVPIQTMSPVQSAKSQDQGAASADSGMRALAQKSGCFACHAIDKKLIGPAWNDVAAKYRGQKDAEARLITKVAKGGGGVWGSTPMPPNAPRVGENDIKSLVRFILSLK